MTLKDSWMISRLLENNSLSSRRAFLKRSVAMGVSIPVVGSLLAACGDDDDDAGDDEPAGGDATPTPRPAGIPTPAGASGDEDDEEETPEAEGDDEPTEADEADDEPTEADEGSADGEPVQGGTMVVLGHEGVDGLSPDYVGPTINWAVITQIHNGMAEMDAWYQYQPVLAESWEISDDGLEYTFALRDGVLFHDGERFTADDVVYTFNFYGDPDNAMITGNNFASVVSTEAVDELTVRVTLDAPNAAFITQGGSRFIVPEHYHGPIGDEEYSRAPIGTGAFMLSEYDPAAFVELVAFEDHFRGRPYLDRYRLNTVPEPSVRAIALETGEADSSVWSLSTDDNIRLRDSGKFKTYVTSSTSLNHVAIDNQAPQFLEREVRQAMMYATDRDSIVDNLWQGLAVKAVTNLSPAIAYYQNPDVAVTYDYDPEKAKQMLDEAGWVPGADGIREKDGVRLEWRCGIIAGDQARRPIAEALQAWVAEIGCKMEIVETTAIIDDLRNHKNQMAVFNWTYGGSGGDPDATSTLHTDWNASGINYSNPEMDDLLERGLAETDPEARKEIYNEVQRLFTEEVPVLFLQFWDWYTFFTPRIKGLPDEILSGTQVYNMAHLLWIDESS